MDKGTILLCTAALLYRESTKCWVKEFTVFTLSTTMFVLFSKLAIPEAFLWMLQLTFNTPYNLVSPQAMWALPGFVLGAYTMLLGDIIELLLQLSLEVSI